jgi:hypothetical protein
MTERADQQEMPTDDRLRRIEGELQHIKMLLTQVVTKLGLDADVNAEAKAQNKPQQEA